MKKTKVVILGVTLSTIIFAEAVMERPKFENKEGKAPGKVDLPGSVKPKAKEENKFEAPKLGTGVRAPKIGERPSTGNKLELKPQTETSRAESNVSITGDHNVEQSKVEQSKPLRTLERAQAPAANADKTTFTGEFVKGLKDDVKLEDKKAEELKDGESNTKAVGKDALEIMEVKAGESTLGGKSGGSFTLKEKASKEYNGALEDTIQKLAEGDKQIEGLLRLFVRRHSKANKNNPNQAAAIEELKASLASFAKIAKQASEILGKDSPLAKHMMRNLLSFNVRSPEKAAELVKSIEAWLNSPNLSKAEKAQTLKGLAITIDTHGGEFNKLFMEGKSFEEAMKAADAKLAEMLKEKLTKEDIEQLAKECLPGSTLRLAAANCARLMTGH